MHLTHREIAQARTPVLIWLAVTAVAGVAGPFGTHEALGLVGRTVYWGGVTGASIALTFAAMYLMRDMGRGRGMLVWAGFVMLLSGLVHMLNSLVFAQWGAVSDWVYLTGTVGLVTVAVNVLVWAVTPPLRPEAAPERSSFARRLPLELRAPLVRIEAQDQYLNVVTARGSTLILMRLSDAMAELAGEGVQVHRSHWISVAAAQQHRRVGGRDLLVMSDGAQVPVSRSFRAAARAAGLF